jgi:hypothetical protein
MFDKIKQYLVHDWACAYKFVSVQLTALLGLVALAEPYIPQLQQYLPQKWIPIACGVIIMARVIQQKAVTRSVKDALSERAS